MQEVLNISPLDGRYRSKIKRLSNYFSKAALIRFRILVEVEYLIALGKEKNIRQVPNFDIEQCNLMRGWYRNYTLADTNQVKMIESKINHDVKAVEYFIKEKITDTDLDRYSEFIHFALTSEDINNISYNLMLKYGLKKNIYSSIEDLLNSIKQIALRYKDYPLLSLTHGQPATPTTIGKEMAVFYLRLEKQFNDLKQIQLEGKLNGAAGNYAAASLAYPSVDWIDFSRRFINSIGLKPNLLTTQIEPHDCNAAVFNCLCRINNIVRDLSQDMWLYISRGIFKLKKRSGEVGSSTISHKVNPIDFENSEGNLGLSNSILRFMAEKLTVSRMQRDLSDSTVIRNQGVALGYAFLGYKNMIHGLNKIEVDQNQIEKELDDHWEVIAEAVQTILRKNGISQAYEKLKDLTRGNRIKKVDIQNFIRELDLDESEKQKLLDLTPGKYKGLSDQLVDLI